MTPIVVSTYPENGSKDVILTDPIKIVFADAIDEDTATEDRITLENLNDRRDIPLTLEYNPVNSELTIYPSDNEYGNYFLGSTEYKLSISNISSPDSELMQGLYTMRFSTVSDSIEDVLPDPGIIEEFSVTNTYPKEGSINATPDVIRVKLNKSIVEESVNSDTFKVTTSEIIDIEDIDLLDIEELSGEYTISDKIISFKPYQEHEMVVGEGAEESPGMLKKEFSLLAGTYYSIVFVSVNGSEKTKEVDYTAYPEENKIVFIDGKEPQVGEEVAVIARSWAPFEDNRRYTVIVEGIEHLEGEETEYLEPVLYSFHTAFSPTYVTIEEIRSNYSSLAIAIRNMDPISLLEIIRENSEFAYWIAEKSENETNITWDPPERIVIEYVKAKTRYDIIFDRYIQLSSEASSKSLGDLDIEYSQSMSDLLLLADRLKLEYKHWENMLKGSSSGKVRSQIFRKGENIDENPEYKNRAHKDWEGNRSW